MVGTPANTVTRSRCSTSRALPGSKRGMRVSVAPASTAVFRAHVWPNAWNRGRDPRMTSSGPSSSSDRVDTAALELRLAWVSSAPLGFPVVPEVYRITAVSESPRSTTSVNASAAPRTSAKSLGCTSTSSAPASSAPARAASSKSYQAMRILAPESDRW